METSAVIVGVFLLELRHRRRAFVNGAYNLRRPASIA